MMTQTEGTPLDEIISRVQSYIENPSLATPETLGELVADLVDLKSVVDGEETPEVMGESDGLAGMMRGSK